MHDLIRRCDRQLEEYESKLHLVERFIRVRSCARRMHDLLSEAQATHTEPDTGLLMDMTREILEEL